MEERSGLLVPTCAHTHTLTYIHTYIYFGTHPHTRADDIQQSVLKLALGTIRLCSPFAVTESHAGIEGWNLRGGNLGSGIEGEN